MSAPFEILHLDNHLMVVNKPPGLLVQADRTGDTDLITLAKAYLKERFSKPGNVFVGLVHRLDRPASGVMVLARTSKAAARLSDQFRRHLPEKDYLAIVAGTLRGAGVSEVHLRPGRGRVEVTDATAEGARAASLQWRAIAEEDRLTLVAVRLKTGRKHQIRAQMAYMGHPILGDILYGARRELDGRNLALHAFSLGFTHPTRKEWVRWTAAPPANWGRRFDQAIKTELARKPDLES